VRGRFGFVGGTSDFRCALGISSSGRLIVRLGSGIFFSRLSWRSRLILSIVGRYGCGRS
jgi:hypothetical protein